MAQVMLYARAGVARSGATRSDYFNQIFKMTVGGVDRSANVWKFTTKIRKQIHDVTDTVTLRTFGFRPQAGQELIIGNGSISNRIFGGHIRKVTQESVKQNVQDIFLVEADDWGWDLNAEMFSAVYENTMAHEIVLDLAAKLAIGYTTNNVKVPSPVIDKITFTNSTFMKALVRIANRVGWRGYVDPRKDIHFFDFETSQVPRTLNPSNLIYDRLMWAEDISQLRTRVFVEGGGGVTTAPVDAGSTFIPIDETGWYDNPAGFQGATAVLLTSGPQRFTYTGRSVSSGPGNITGIPASGAGSIAYDIRQGDPVRLLVQVDDALAQAALGTVTGGRSIVESYTTDNRISLVEMVERGQQELLLWKLAVNNGTYWTTDKQADVGKLVTIALPARGISKQIAITEVEISYIAHQKWQRSVVLDSSIRLDLLDLLKAAAERES